MIPSLTIRADNAFGIPLIREYAQACRNAAMQLPGEERELQGSLIDRAEALERLSLEFDQWGGTHPAKVRLDRSFDAARDPGNTLREARRRLKERAAAHDRDLTDLRTQLDTARRRIGELETRAAEVEARRIQALPQQFATPRPG